MTRSARRKTRLLSGVMTGVLAAAAGVGHVQTAAAQEEERDVIIVTATKRATDLQTTSAAISAFDAEDLEVAGVSSVEDLQAIVPGLIVSGNSGQELPIALRGISSGQQGPGGDSPVAIYLDGVYLGRPLATVFEFANIERVEVLRGPQGTVYGRNVTGGAINVITRAPSEEFEGRGLIRYGRFNEFLVSGAVSGQVASGLNAFIGGSSHRDDGYSVRVSDGDNRNPINSNTINFGLDWDAGANLTANLRGDFSTQDVAPDSRPFSDSFTGFGLGTFPLDSDAIFTNEDTFERVRSGGLGLTVDWDLGELNLRSVTGGRFYEQDMLIDNDLTSFRAQRFNMNLDTSQFSQEFNLTNGTGNFVDWLLGAYLYSEDSDGRYAIQSFLAVPDTPDPDTTPENFIVGGNPDLTTDSWAIFADTSINLTDQLTLGLGVRYSHEEKTFFRTGGSSVQLSGTPDAMNPAPRFVPILVDAPEYDAEDSWNSLTPRVSLEYEFNDDMFGYVSYQEGFKSGGYSFSAGGPIPNPSFDPEEIKAYEIGLKSDWFGGQLRTNLAAFTYDYTGLQVSLATSPAVRSIFNAATADVDGLEIETQWSPDAVPGLHFAFNATYLDATYGDFIIDFSGYPSDGAAAAQCPGGVFTPGVRTCELGGNELRRAPEWSYTFAGSYDIQVGRNTLTPSFLYRHEDPLFFTEQNLPDAGHGNVDLLDARVTYAFADADWSIALWGENLTDERYVNQATPANVRASFVPGPAFLGTGATGTLGTVNRPRTYGVEVSFQY